MRKNRSILLIIGALLIGFLAGSLFFSTESHPKETHLHMAGENQTWTCSMHPQIKQDQPGLCPICGMELVPQTQSSIDNPFVLEMSETALQLAQIQTTIVGTQNQDFSSSILLNGRLMADETQTARLVNHIPGRIEKLAVDYTGAPVAKGQPIAWVYAPELITVQKELLEAKKIESLSPGLLHAAKNKLKYWKRSEAFIDELLSAKTIVETFPLYAEHSGVVVQKNVTVGDYIKRGEVLFEVQNLNQLWAVFEVYEKDLAQISVGQTLTFKTPAFPNQQFSGKVHFIDPRIDAQTRVAEIRVEVKNPQGILKPEMFVTGMLDLVNEKSEGLWIPKSAVLWTGKRSVVYVKEPQQTVPSFSYREVVLGALKGSEYRIEKGLRAGEEVVTHGAFVIDAKAQINNKTSMMNRKVNQENPNHSEPMTMLHQAAPQAFQKGLSEVTAVYLKLKDAFVNSDENAAATEALKMLEKLNQLDKTYLGTELSSFWNEKENEISLALNKLHNEPNITQQRKQFDILSQSLIASVKVLGVHQQALYVQFCPMANENNGAQWLSDQKHIENPYYGAAMLRCGSVVETLTEE